MLDYNDTAEQTDFTLIPSGTIVPVQLEIAPGGYNDPSMGWNGDWATQGNTGSVYLNCKFIVQDGKYAKRKVYTNIGLHSPKGNTWGEMGRSFIKALLNSAQGIDPKDMSPQAKRSRCIQSFGDLNGLCFIAEIGIEPDGKGVDRNIIRKVIEPGNPAYATAMNGDAPVKRTTPPAHTTAPKSSTAPDDYMPF